MKPLVFLSPIHQASRQIGFYLEPTCRHLQISGIEGHLLAYLAVYTPRSVGDLKKVFGLKPSTLTAMLDRLETAELIQRSPNPEDRRSWLVSIQPRGAEIAATLRSVIEDLETSIRHRVSERDLDGFRAVMRAIAQQTETPHQPKESPP